MQNLLADYNIAIESILVNPSFRYNRAAIIFNKWKESNIDAEINYSSFANAKKQIFKD